MSKILYYIFFLITCELVLSEEFQNQLGDNNISDDYPNTISRGIIPTNDYAKLKIGGKQDIYVNLIAGNLIYKRLDYYLFDIGFPIVIEFTYNSGSSFKGRFGKQWQLSYNIRYVENNFNKNIILIDNDDKGILFKENKSKYSSNYPNYQIQKNENTIIIENFRDNYYKFDDYVRYNFNSNLHNYISSIEDRNLNKINFTYNADKQLVSIKYPSGRNINFYYDNNLLSKISIPDYGNIIYKYDENNSLLTVEYPNQVKIFYRYDSNCNFLSQVINDKDTTVVEYENNNSVKKLYRKNSEIEYNFQYDFVNRQNKLSYKSNEQLAVFYDSLNRTTKIIKHGNDYKSITWDTLNRITNFKDALNQSFTYYYSDDGKLIEYFNPENKRIKFSYEDKYKRINRKSINSSILDFDLDEKANIISIRKNGELTKTFLYDNFGQISKYKKINDEYEFLYDGLGNFKRIIINNDLEFSFEYNNQNYLTNVSEIGEFSISANYHDNRIDLVNNYDKLRKSIFYNYESRIDSIYDNDNIINRYFYDNSSRLTKFSQDSLFDIIISYKNDSTISVLSPIDNYSILNNFYDCIKQVRDIHLYEFKYDKLNRLIEKSINGQNLIKYSYNSESLIKQITIPKLSVIDIIYDNLNRLASIKKLGGLSFSYSWDNFDRLINYNENSRNYSFIYNENSYSVKFPSLKLINVLTATRFKEINYLNYIVRYNLDRYGRTESILRNNNEIYNVNYRGNLITKKILNGKNEFNYYYNESSKLSQINNNDDYIKSFLYDKYNRIIRLDNNGLITRYNYDQFNRITSMILSDETSINLNYSYDHIIIAFNNIDFKYDFINGQLTRISNPNSDNVFINYTNFLYPNRIVAPEGVSINLEFNNINKISSIIDFYGNQTRFNYDDNENLVSLFNKNSFSRSFKFNNDNQIIEYIDFDGGKFRINFNEYFMPSKILLKNNDSINYEYDHNLNLKSFRNFNGLKVQFNYDDYGNLLKLFDANDTINYEYSKNDKLEKVKFDDKFTIQYDYKNELLDQIIFNDSVKFELTYDKINLLNKISVGKVLALNLIRDKQKNITFQQIWQGRPTLFNYNELGRIIEINNEINKKFNYDKLGRLIQITANNEFKENYNYDYNSRIISKEDFSKNFLTYSYDKKNNIVLITRNFLDSIKYEFNNLDKVISSKINNREVFSILFSDFRIKSISNHKNKVDFKWLGFNYKNLQINDGDFLDTTIIDNYFRITYNKKTNLYNDFGLIHIIDKDTINYDKYLRLIHNDFNNFKAINYFGFNFSPSSFNFKSNNFFTKFNENYKLLNLIFENDTIKISNSQFSNLINFEKNQFKIFDFYFDGFGNNSYFFLKLNKLIKENKDDINYGFEDKKINLEYLYNNNLKNVNFDKRSLFKFEYNDLGNILLNDDAEGNLVQFSYLDDQVSEINYSNGKFIKYLYDNTQNLIGAYSNSNLSDSIAILGNKQNQSKKEIIYFGEYFKIFNESGNYILAYGNRNYSLFGLNKDINGFILNNIVHEYKEDTAFITNNFSVSFNNLPNLINQGIKINNDQINLIDKLNIYGNLISTMINSETIFDNKFDELDRLIYSKNGILNTFQYNLNNNFSSISKDLETFKFDYSDKNKVQINEKKYYFNSNKSITKVIDLNDTTFIFYDFADRMANLINESENIKILYNSLGELSAVINDDTTLYFNFTFDSIDVSIIFNNSKSKFDLYFRKFDNFQFPIIKYDLNSKKIKYLIRNASGYPVLLIDENNNNIIIKGNNPFGERPFEINDFAYYFKNYICIEQVGLLFENGKVINPENNLQYNYYARNYVDELSSLNNNLFKVPLSKSEDCDYIGINVADLIEPINPIDNNLSDIIHRNKVEIISDEINSIFNGFKVFNIDFKIKNEKNQKIEEMVNLDNYLVDLDKLIKSFDSEIKFFPKLPRELLDSTLLQNLKTNEIYNPELYLENKDKIGQVKQLLKLAEVDPKFILFEKLNDIEQMYDQININYPCNIIELEINKIDVQLINNKNNSNALIKHLSNYQDLTSEQDTVLRVIKDYLYINSVDKNYILNKPYLANSDIALNENIINNLMPINLELIEKIPIDNINRIIKLVSLPYPKYFIPSLHLYDNNLLLFPMKNKKINVIDKFILQKQYKEVK